MFSKYYGISEAAFFDSVDTGDVVLFRTKDNGVAWMQRAVLNS